MVDAMSLRSVVKILHNGWQLVVETHSAHLVGSTRKAAKLAVHKISLTALLAEAWWLSWIGLAGKHSERHAPRAECRALPCERCTMTSWSRWHPCAGGPECWCGAD